MSSETLPTMGASFILKALLSVLIERNCFGVDEGVDRRLMRGLMRGLVRGLVRGLMGGGGLGVGKGVLSGLDRIGA